MEGSLFIPLPKFRAVVGGSFGASRSGLQSFTLDQGVGLGGSIFPLEATGVRAAIDSTTDTAYGYSLIAARQFGSEGRTSLGIGLDHLSGQSSLLSLTSQLDESGLITRERLDSRSSLQRTRFTLGFTHDFAGSHKLGLFYRHGTLSVDNRDRSHILDGVPLALDSTRSSGHTSEIGLRLRGYITPRLFYGVEGTTLFANTDEQIRQAVAANANEHANTTRVTGGFGLGYALSARMVFSFDVAGGLSHTHTIRRDDITGNIAEDERQRTRFLSLHAGMQADLWRRLFASASVLFLAQARVTDLANLPGGFAGLTTSDGVMAPAGLTHRRFNDTFSDFGIGWRFSPNFLIEYVLSTGYGQNRVSHLLLIRYTFNPGKK
jgi:hypothetical protein